MKKLSLLLLTAISCFNADAQKLPNVQQTGLRAPAKVKIDGKTTEWGNFTADNYATGLHYTMANDDKNLYLAIQADDANVLTKLTNHGVALSIHPRVKKVLGIQFLSTIRCSSYSIILNRLFALATPVV